jgi:protein gp37
MSKTTIEWVRNADGTQGFTVNPIRFRNLGTGKIGHHCTKISPGCMNCYASKQQSPYLSDLAYTAENTAKGEFFFEEKVLGEVLRRRKPATYFWCDCTDLFGDWVPNEWIDRIAATCALTPQHRHFWLTKRAERMRDYFGGPGLMMRWGFWASHAIHVRDGGDAVRAAKIAEFNVPKFPLPNVALGVSVEDKAHLDRLDYLRQTPAALRWFSAEPLLGDLGRINLDGIDWVVCGGESGPGARPMKMEWPQSVIQQCKAAAISVFMKQICERGKKVPFDQWSEDLKIQEIPDALQGS